MNGRRSSDKCSTDKALELVCAKAYQQVLESGEDTAIIEVAINKCRELKVIPTVEFKILTEDCTKCATMLPGYECKHCGRLA